MTECKTEVVGRSGTLLSFPNRSALNLALSAAIANTLRQAIVTKGTASIAFSGGSTPAPMLEQLAKASVDWRRVHATLVDERWVAADHKDSNESQLRHALQRGDASQLAITGLKTKHTTPEQAIETVNTHLDALTWPLDCVHLGMGADGHTASWFADAPEYARAINRTHTSRVIALNPKAAPHPRISLTAHAVLGAKTLVIHITGEDKRKVLGRALAGDKTLPISVALNRSTPTTIYWAP